MAVRFGEGEGIERIAAFSDGVFSIAITLLVLNLHVPEIASDAPDETLVGALLEDLPNLQAYVLSFVVVGLFWITHHRVFSHIRRYDATLIWLNLLLLLFVSVIPFPTALLGRHGGEIPVRLYAATLAAASFVLALIWWYATQNRRLVDRELDPLLVRYATLRGLTTLLLFLTSVAVSYFSDDAALGLLVLFPLVMAGLGRIFHRQEADDRPFQRRGG